MDMSRDIYGKLTNEERAMIDELDSRRNELLEYRFTPINEPSLVLDNFLFLGTHHQASDSDLLRRLKIKNIINVCDLKLRSLILDNFNVVHIELIDEPNTNISQHFESLNQLLREYYEKNERCLVHCAAGVSRSATIVLAYLMKYHHKTLRDAALFLLHKRPVIRPNEGFFYQLLCYEKELRQKRERISSNETSTIEQNPIQSIDEFEQEQKTMA